MTIIYGKGKGPVVAVHNQLSAYCRRREELQNIRPGHITQDRKTFQFKVDNPQIPPGVLEKIVEKTNKGKNKNLQVKIKGEKVDTYA